MTFGARLLRHRKNAGLSQEELSERSGVSVRAISDMEGGRARSPQRRTTEAILDALDLDEQDREELRGLARSGRVAPPGPVWSLPLYVADLVGRDAELDTIAGTRGGLVVVHGAAGMGKTSLAVRAAHLLEERFPDGQLLIELEGSTPPLQRLLKDLGVTAEHLPEDAHGQARLYRSLLAGKRLLLVLDSASTEEEVRTLVQHTRGIALNNAGRLADARDQLAAAADGMADPEAKVSVLIAVADVCDRLNDHDAATRHRLRALAESDGYASPGMTKLQQELTNALRLSA